MATTKRYEVNYYKTESGDGEYYDFYSLSQARKTLLKLTKDKTFFVAYIRVHENEDTIDEFCYDTGVIYGNNK